MEVAKGTEEVGGGGRGWRLAGRGRTKGALSSSNIIRCYKIGLKKNLTSHSTLTLNIQNAKDVWY